MTGVTGQVARPLALALARDNEVYGAARFTDSAARGRLEAAGVHCVPVDLVAGDVSGIAGRRRLRACTSPWPRPTTGRSTWRPTVGAWPHLMEHHQHARAFLHCSTTGVYKPEGHREFAEDGPLGDNHGVWPFLRTYSICKIAAEGTARWAAERFELPTTIARLSVPYGDGGGWPAIHLHMMLYGPRRAGAHRRAERVPPMHQDDILAMVPKLLGVAGVPATTVNWGGSEAVSIEEWCAYLADLTGIEARFDPTPNTIDSVQIDTTRMHELVGRTTVHWKDGMRRMVESLHPDKVR